MRGRLRRREAVLRETPPPFHGRASMRGRLRRREAVLRETPPPFHGRASMRGRLRRREAVLRETPPPPLSANPHPACIRAMAAALDTSPRSGAARLAAALRLLETRSGCAAARLGASPGKYPG
jgi:hypothetical protein